MLRNLTKLYYTIENVRELLEYANGRPTSAMEVANLSRPGKTLSSARVRYGVFDRKATDTVMTAILRRRLAAELGRTSPRFVDIDFNYTCPECNGIAVIWNGSWKCEHGHTDIYTEKENT